MFVIGVDPGLSRCGYAVVRSGKRGQGQAVALGVLKTAKADTTPVRLAELQRDFRSLLDEYQPSVVAVERVFFTRNAQTAVGVIQSAGVVLAEAAAREVTVAEYTPTEMKSVVAGDGTATKRQVQQMVQLLLGLPYVPQPPDAADAAGMALCWLSMNPTSGLRPVVAL